MKANNRMNKYNLIKPYSKVGRCCCFFVCRLAQIKQKVTFSPVIRLHCKLKWVHVPRMTQMIARRVMHSLMNHTWFQVNPITWITAERVNPSGDHHQGVTTPQGHTGDPPPKCLDQNPFWWAVKCPQNHKQVWVLYTKALENASICTPGPQREREPPPRQNHPSHVPKNTGRKSLPKLNHFVLVSRLRKKDKK